MREETRRKLERADLARAGQEDRHRPWRRGLIGAFFVYEDYDARVDNVRVPATVVSIGPLNIDEHPDGRGRASVRSRSRTATASTSWR